MQQVPIRALRLLSIVVPLSLSSCGGKLAEGLRPHEHTANEALGNPSSACTSAPAYAQPLVVDLDSNARVDLEAGLDGSAVIVHYDCTELRVLANCHMKESSYDYAGVSRKEQVVQIASSADLQANLPLSHVKLGGEIKSGRSIDLGLVLVGRRSTTVESIGRDQLVGNCEGATHFVQNATLGAFSVSTGTIGKAAAVADIFGYGASASSESQRHNMSNDGSLEACRASQPGALEPPQECRAPVRLELIPLADTTVVAKAGDRDDAPPPVPQRNPCPPDYRWADGLCTATAAPAYLCNPSDAAECKSQCDKGSGESCYNYGVLLQHDKRIDDAVPFYLRACEADVIDACGAYSRFATSAEEGAVGLAINRKVLAVAEHGCTIGSGEACNSVGDLRYDKEYGMVDFVAAAASYERGCALGDNSACFMYANMLLRGKGVRTDSKHALAVLQRACEGGDGSMCYEIWNVLGNGRYGVAKDPVGAYAGAAAACRRDPDFCIDASRAAAQLGKDDESFAHAKFGCDHDDDAACVRLGDLYRDGRGTAKDVDKAKQLWTKTCAGGSDDGDEVACKRIGVRMKSG